MLAVGVTVAAAFVGLVLQPDFAYGSISLARTQPGVTLEGFSGQEPFGRWTDGDVARLRFNRPLPRRFGLKFRGHAFAGNDDKSVDVRVGGVSRRTLLLTAADADYAVDLESAWLANDIEFVIPHATSPRSLGQSEDARRLGVAFSTIEILPR